MTYNKHTWDNETISDPKLQNIEDGLEDVDERVTDLDKNRQGPLTATTYPPIVFYLYVNATEAGSVGGVAMDGGLIHHPGPFGLSLAPLPSTFPSQTATYETATVTSNTLVLDQRFRFPAHDPCTIKRITSTISMGVADGETGGSVNLDWTRTEIVLEAIDSAGNVRTLDTDTFNHTGNQSSGGTNVYLPYSEDCTADYGAGHDILAGETAVIRLKGYCSQGGTNGAYLAVNADGGTNTVPTISGAYKSLFIIDFE